MFVSVTKHHDRYLAIVGANPKDDNGAFFNSLYDFYLIPSMPSSFQTFAEAYAAGQKIATKIPSLILAKKEIFYRKFADGHGEPQVENEIAASYESQLMLLKHRFTTIHSEDETDQPELYEALRSEADEVIKGLKALLDDEKITDETKSSFQDTIDELDSLVQEIEATGMVEEKPEASENAPGEAPDLAAMLGGAPDPNGMPPQPGAAPMGMPMGAPAPGQGMAMASRRPTKARMHYGEIIQTFGEAAALGIQPQHPEVFLRRVEWNDGNECFYATLAEPRGDIVTLGFTPALLLNQITPHNRLHKECSYQSQEFVEKYWEPIVYAVGHFYHAATQTVMVPQYPQSKRFVLSGFNYNTKQPVTARIETIGSTIAKNKSWLIKSAQVSAPATPTEEQLRNAQVRCIKRELPTYFGRTGMVTQVIPRADYTDVVVDFGRGLDSLVLTERDVEIIGELRPNA